MVTKLFCFFYIKKGSLRNQKCSSLALIQRSPSANSFVGVNMQTARGLIVEARSIHAEYMGFQKSTTEKQ